MKVINVEGSIEVQVLKYSEDDDIEELVCERIQDGQFDLKINSCEIDEEATYEEKEKAKISAYEDQYDAMKGN